MHFKVIAVVFAAVALAFAAAEPEAQPGDVANYGGDDHKVDYPDHGGDKDHYPDHGDKDHYPDHGDHGDHHNYHRLTPAHYKHWFNATSGWDHHKNCPKGYDRCESGCCPRYSHSCGKGCCPKGYDCCKNKGCSPYGATCCSNGGYCNSGYYCVEDYKKYKFGCCPKGKKCKWY
ncbi:hypothetical protein BKA62DRAFT_714045 [Auriculariales sp. MPI-PUGE-AT-0066]|nr:hypothetical protein BKA62DRAFT_714045 [Auriculariales sp. MPI-PUGE-AT-0066]